MPSECASGGRAFVLAGPSALPSNERSGALATGAVASRWRCAAPGGRVRRRGGRGRLGRIAAEARVVQREVARVGREQLQEVRLPITARRRARRRRAVSQHWSRRTGPFGTLRARTRAERRGEARQGKARHGKARHSTARHGKAGAEEPTYLGFYRPRRLVDDVAEAERVHQRRVRVQVDEKVELRCHAGWDDAVPHGILCRMGYRAV